MYQFRSYLIARYSCVCTCSADTSTQTSTITYKLQYLVHLDHLTLLPYEHFLLAKKHCMIQNCRKNLFYYIKQIHSIHTIYSNHFILPWHEWFEIIYSAWFLIRLIPAHRLFHLLALSQSCIFTGNFICFQFSVHWCFVSLKISFATQKYLLGKVFQRLQPSHCSSLCIKNNGMVWGLFPPSDHINFLYGLYDAPSNSH